MAGELIETLLAQEEGAPRAVSEEDEAFARRCIADVLEINPDHRLIEKLRGLQAEGDEARLPEWIEVLYAQALITEGSPLPDPNAFAQRLTGLLEQAAGVS